MISNIEKRKRCQLYRRILKTTDSFRSSDRWLAIRGCPNDLSLNICFDNAFEDRMGITWMYGGYRTEYAYTLSCEAISTIIETDPTQRYNFYCSMINVWRRDKVFRRKMK